MKDARWVIAAPRPTEAARLAGDLGVSPLLAQCLINRGLTTAVAAEAFLTPRLRDLADPFHLPAMGPAVDRLCRARERGEEVVVFGDYDVDGVTATALLKLTLTQLGWRVRHYLPRRLEEGYGLSADATANCLAQLRPTLLLAVDCGSTAVETIQELGASGVDVIVLDHHQVSCPPPQPVALVNPRLLTDSSAADAGLCSVGLAFKLSHALVKEGRRRQWPGSETYDLRPFLDLVALGTIADVVPLQGENRILVTAGLRALARTSRVGLRALQTVAQVRQPPGVYEVGFQLAPRLNAAGRLETAAEALELLLTQTASEAQALAEKLEEQNRERQSIERTIASEAIQSVRANFDPARDYVIVEGRSHWHIGVVGIVASRVLREFHRPTLVLGSDGDAWRGSGRSIDGFDLAAALRACDELLLRHGGHTMAVGLSVRPEQLETLRERLNHLARQWLTVDQLRPTVSLDADCPLAQLTFEFVQELQRLEPVGSGNPPPQFRVGGVRLRQLPQRMGRQNQHARFSITDGTTSGAAVWWNCEARALPQGVFDLAVVPQLDTYQGRTTVQLKVLDWQPNPA